MKKLTAIIAASAFLITAGGSATAAMTYAPKEGIVEVAQQESVQHLNKYSELEDLVDNNEYVVFEASAWWCGPCQAFKPVYEKVAKEYSAKGVVFTTADVTKVGKKEQKKFISALGTSKVPTVGLYRDGKLIKKEIGYMNEATFKKFLDDNYNF